MSKLNRGLCQSLMVSILGLMVAVPLGAGAPPAGKANWDNLKQLVTGQEIQIVLNDAKSFQGKFQSVSDAVRPYQRLCSKPYAIGVSSVDHFIEIPLFCT